jgi:hypothetical protein
MHEEGEEALKSQVRLLRCLVRLTRQTHIVRRAKTDLRTLAATIKARWICEQAHQQLNEELGLDHFEGRSWQGLHRHALMTMIAYAFLQYRRLKNSKAGKKESTGRRRDRHCPPCARPSSSSSLDHRRSHARAAENGFAAKSSVNKSAKVVLS